MTHATVACAGGPGTWRIEGFSWRTPLLAVVFVVLALAPRAAAAQAKPKNVLVLSGGRGRVSINLMQSSLRARFPEPVNFSIVDLENPRFDQPDYQEHFAAALRSGYAGEKLDLIVAVMTPSLEFAVQYGSKVFPGVPIVFMSVSTPLPGKMWPGVTGVESPLGVPEIIDLALRLHPDTEAVAVITNVVGVDKDWLLAERAALLRHRAKIREIDLIGPPSPELLQKVAALPPRTVVLFQLFPQDSDQLAFGANDVLASVAQRLPTYSILPLLDRGAVGAATYDATNDAVLAGQLAARVLSGERADDIPVVQNSNVLVSVDWRAGASAPTPDTEAVTSEVRNDLAIAEERIERCIDGADLREDPLRSRTRRLTVVFHFSRSGTPRVSVERNTMPPLVRQCILEAARSVRASTAPRGDVTVRAVYELR